MPGPIPNPIVDQYQWNNFHRLFSAVEALCAIDAYEYQACEHPSWWDSGAHHFCERFRKALIKCLPGYENAAGEWTADRVLARQHRLPR